MSALSYLSLTLLFLSSTLMIAACSGGRKDVEVKEACDGERVIFVGEDVLVSEVDVEVSPPKEVIITPTECSDGVPLPKPEMSIELDE